MTASVGVVGLGAMGGAMAANLVASGHAVIGHDVDPERLERLSAAGGTPAASAGAVAAASDVVVLSLPSAAAFAAVAVDPDGLAAGARPGLVVVETSTLPLAVKERARQALDERGVVLLDCPLSGTGDQAVHRDLVVLASGDREAIARCGPIFDGFARATHVVGPFGTGTRMKLVANLLVAIHNVAAAEALVLAERAGLDLGQVVAVLGDSAATSRMLEVRGPKMVERDYSSGVTTRVFRKDLAAIAALTEECGAPAPLLRAVTPLYEAAVPEADTAAVFEVLRCLSR